MAKKYDDIGGVWRTIGGRRVFIKDGQSLESAMKESGKFKLKKNEKDSADSDPRDVVMYHLKKGEFKKAEEYIREYGLDDDREMFMAGLNSGAKSDYKEYLKKERDLYESKVYGSDVQKADEELKKTFGKDFKYKEEMEEIDKEVSNMYGKDLREAYNALEDDDNSYEAKAIRKEYEKRTANEKKFHEATKSMMKESNQSSNDESFTMAKGDKTVTVSKNDEGKWEDSEGNKYMGYLSKEDVKSYFKDDWKEVKETSNKSGEEFARKLDKQDIGKWVDNSKSNKDGSYSEIYQSQGSKGSPFKKGEWVRYDYDKNGKRESVESYPTLEEAKAGKKYIHNPDSKETIQDKYFKYYKKENLGEPKNFNKDDEIEFNSSYDNNLKGTIVREATDEEKRYQINSNLKGYIVRDNLGHEHVVADTRIKKIKDKENSITNSLREKAHEKLNKSLNALNRIDDIAGNDEKLQKLARQIGLNDLEKYNKAWKEYKKEHPNSKINLYTFIKMNEE